MSAQAAGLEAADQVLPRSDLKLVRRLLAYLTRHKKLLLGAFLLYPLDALSVVIPPYLVQRILDVAVPQRNLDLLMLYGGIYVLALAFEYASGFFSQLAMGVLGQRAMRELRSDLFAHVLRLPTAFFDKNPMGRTLTRLTNDVESLVDVFATGAITVIADIITIIAVVGTMLWLDVRLTLFSFLVVPLLVLCAVVFQRYAREAFREIRRSIARINAFLAEHLGAMNVVQAFCQELRTQQEFVELNAHYRDANRRAVLADALLFSIVEAIGTAAVAVLLWYGAQDLSLGAVGAGTLVAFMQYIRRFFVPVRDLSTKYTVLQSGFAGAERIFQLFDEPVTIASRPAALPISRLTRGIELDDVWFSYRNPPTDRDWVLKGLNLRIERGERVALVGPTGSGKTSVLKLLSRFYDVQRGAVRVDGVDVRDLHLSNLRQLYAVVLQDVHLFAGTLQDNMTVAERVTKAAVRKAAEAVQVGALVARLPQGYDTEVRSAGMNFSAGERQLLAFARALALDPDVLILDEATSSIDTETEARIQSALDLLLADRTAIIVAHRLSTIRKVDRIVVLQHGHVMESGSHDALMAHNGMYRKLVDLQLSRSQET